MLLPKEIDIRYAIQQLNSCIQPDDEPSSNSVEVERIEMAVINTQVYKQLGSKLIYSLHAL